MSAVSRKLGSLKEHLKAQMIQSRRAYALALEMESSPDPLRRLAGLFEADGFEAGLLEIEPYSPFLPAIWLGFDKSADYCVKIHSIPVASPNAQESRDFIIQVDGEGRPKWLSLEFEVAWPILRAARAVSMSVFGHKELKSTEELDDQFVQIFVHDTDGNRHDVLPPKSFLLPDRMGQARLDVDVRLPPSLRLDTARSPVMAVFFSPRIRRIVLSDIFVDFIPSDR